MRISIVEGRDASEISFFEGDKLIKKELCSAEEAIRLLFKYPRAAICNPLPGSSLYYLWRDINAKTE